MDFKDLIKKWKNYFNLPLAFVAGMLVTWALAPYNNPIFGMLSPAILLWCLSKTTAKRAALVGFLYGLGLFYGANWIYVSIHDFGNAPPLLAGLITGLFIMAMSLYPALMAYLLNRYFPKSLLVKNLLAFPALWTLFEIIRGVLFTGFPWLFLGYTQMNNHLSALAPIGSVYFMSFACAWLGGVLYLIFDYYFEYRENPPYRNRLFMCFIATWVVAFGLKQIPWTTPTTQTAHVALIQGNVAQLMRWDPAYLRLIINTYKNLTYQTQANFIVWPENALPLPWPNAAPILQEMDAYAKANQFGLILGLPIEAQKQYYNGLVSIGATEKTVNQDCSQKLSPGCVYFKSHLVPFGEYVPLEQYLRGLIAFFDLPMSSFVPGSGHQTPIESNGWRFAPAICYEIAYPEFVRNMSQNADVILTVSNDTWFGHSIGPAQHLQIAQMRALENGKYVARATNTGLTAIIDYRGKLTHVAPSFEETVLVGSVAQMSGWTLWSVLGIWPLVGLLFVALGIAYRFRHR